MIGIDYTAAYEQGAGIGRYVRELITALAHQDSETTYRLYVQGAGRKPLPTLPGGNFRWAATRITPEWFFRFWHRLRLPIPVETWVGRVRLYHATDFVLPPTLPSTPTVLTVHDLSFVRVPEAAPPSLKAYLDVVVPRSARRADYVLADSHATKDDLIDLYKLPEAKIEVLYSGVNPRFCPTALEAALREKYRIGASPYILAVGTVQPRKNYARLIEALAALPPDLADVHLVIAGGRGWLQDPIYATVAAQGLTERVHFIGFAEDADLPALYTGARLLAFPSLYEGFGLPILEAFACGTPVLTAGVSSLGEVAGDAALLVDPLQVDSIRAGLEVLLRDDTLRAGLIERGYAQASRFTWDAAAKQLREVYRRFERRS
ncbi:MAG: glycosyltransferase family 4 protein [Anaerolineales bacterium]|nr:glycosyltransferase family 4 protein [Anaerolineales bacterium]